MKRFILCLIVATLFGPYVMAQDSQEKDSYGDENYIYVSPSTIYINPQTLMGSLEVWLDNVTDDFNTYMMDIYLPEGFSIPKKDDSSDFDIQINKVKTPSHSVRVSQRSDGSYRVIGFSLMDIPIATGKGMLFTATIQAPESFGSTSTQEEGSIKNINIAAGTGSDPAHYFPDVEFEIKYYTFTGVNQIEDSGILSPSNIYSIQGVLLKRDASQEDIDALEPGLYLIGGRKVLVK